MKAIAKYWIYPMTWDNNANVRRYRRSEEDAAKVFTVYERESDGSHRWVADFGERAEAERWKAAIEKEEANEV